MNHISYNKIESDSNAWDKNYKKVKKWAITEKVHGSNFSFVWENGIMSYSKRTGIIGFGENFFNYSSILESVEPKIYQIVNLIIKDFPNINKIIVFGELFGGIYPKSSELSKSKPELFDSNFIPVQKGIYYSPSIHFIAFDIFICSASKSYYLDFADSIKYFLAVGLLHTEPIKIFDSYEKASGFELGFDSIIPTKLGLEQMKKGTNKAEGIVIRSMGNHNLRYIVKKKIPEFSEFDYDYSNNTLNLQDKKTIGLGMITTNRLNNAISKIGLLEDYRYDIYDLICKDILDELEITDSNEKKKLKIFFMDEIKKKFNEN
jgi:Rnl2 family RNA ligase